MVIERFEDIIKGANGYFKTAIRAFYKKSVFSDELIFNILTMSIEKYLVGLLMSIGIMPANHVIKYLLEETEEHFKIDVSIQKHLAAIDDYLYLCSVDNFTKNTPPREDLEKMINAVEKLKFFVQEHTSFELV
jgi:HEPN domain-containing protein